MANTKKLFAKAEKLLQKQKLDSALEIFLKIFKDEPHDETVLLNLADLSLRLDRPENSLRYNRLLADLYVERKDFSKAVVTCRKILRTAPQDAPTLSRLATLLAQTNKTADAIDAFREAAGAWRHNGDTARALECVQHWVDLEPGSLEAHAELAELASDSGKPALAAQELLQSAEIARKKGLADGWADLVERAHKLDPANEAGCVAAAEVGLARDRASDAAALLEALSPSRLNEATVQDLLCRAYLRLGEYGKAGPVCVKLYQAHPEAIGLIEQLIRGFLGSGETAKALALVEEIRDQMCQRQDRKAEFLALIEQVYHADENNLDVLELLPPLYNELNREEDLRRSLSRLFSLYVAGEQYNKAADTLEGILDVDAYGAGHSERLLNLEGHIDAIWYGNMASRISLPGVGQRLAPGPSGRTGEEGATEGAATLDDLMVEAEMYHRYHLDAKLEETLQKINRLYPGAQEDNEPLRDLYELAGFSPTPVQRPPAEDAVGPAGAATPPGVPGQLSAEELEKLSAITSSIHRQGTPERVLRATVDHLGRLVGASRCWVAIGSPDTAALTAEYVSPGIPPSDPAAASGVFSFLMHRASVDPEGWTLHDVSGAKQVGPIAPELKVLEVVSLLGMPLADKEELAGILLVEQCRELRRWTPGEKMLLKAVAPQVVIAANNAKLRRLVRSLAGTDLATGLYPRTAYLDWLLAEARRAETHSRVLSVCLMEPADADGLSRKFGEAEMQSYFQQVSKAVSSHVRENDIAVRYGPYTIALCLPDTPLAQTRMAVERLLAILHRTSLGAGPSPAFSAAVSDLTLAPGFDAVDAVTEVINRLEASMETLRTRPEAGILVSRFEGQTR